MRNNRFFGFCVSMIALAMAGCTPQADWFSEYGDAPTGEPVQIMSGAHYDDMRMYGGFDASEYGIPSIDSGAPVQNIAVMVPLSGTYADIGRDIRMAVESAYLQRPVAGAAITFYDIARDRDATISAALATNPAIIIGPVFADDVRALRSAKPVGTPVLAFSSDTDAIGNGVMTMALMPTQSIEAIAREMSRDKIKHMLIVAPASQSGKIMAGTAIVAAEIYGMDVAGMLYYTEKDSDSIKNAAHRASLFEQRTAANTRAREILADILTNEELTAAEKDSLTRQLEKISKSETLGRAPFDAVLFLGDGADSKTLASFLRYYGVGTRDARFYGTALWDGADIIDDFSMSGAKFATLPDMSAAFSTTYAQLSGMAPGRLASFGYDATNLATGMIASDKTNAAYLLDPSGYRGIDGLVRMTPHGANERALRIVQLNATPTPTPVRDAAQNFMTPLYNIDQRKITPAREIEMRTRGINPDDFIKIPQRFADKYRSQTYGATIEDDSGPSAHAMTPVVISATENDAAIMAAPEFQPASLETVRRTYIDTVEIGE